MILSSDSFLLPLPPLLSFLSEKSMEEWYKFNDCLEGYMSSSDLYQNVIQFYVMRYFPPFSPSLSFLLSNHPLFSFRNGEKMQSLMEKKTDMAQLFSKIAQQVPFLSFLSSYAFFVLFSSSLLFSSLLFSSPFLLLPFLFSSPFSSLPQMFETHTQILDEIKSDNFDHFDDLTKVYTTPTYTHVHNIFLIYLFFLSLISFSSFSSFSSLSLPRLFLLFPFSFFDSLSQEVSELQAEGIRLAKQCRGLELVCVCVCLCLCVCICVGVFFLSHQFIIVSLPLRYQP